MRVLIVTTWFPDTRYPGTAPFNVAHAKAIARNNDVRVVHAQLGANSRINYEEYAGVSVTRLPINPKRPLDVALNLNVLRKLTDNADVVHSMAFSSIGVLAPLYPLIASRWVHTEHWSGVAFPDRIPGPWSHFALARYLLRLPRRVSTVSDFLAQAVRTFARPNAVDVIPPVVPRSFQPAPQPSWEPLKLIAVGGLVAGKRPELAIDTLMKLLEAGVDARLTWVGNGILYDKVQQRAEDLGVCEQTALIGAVAPAQVGEYLRAANIFFLPTEYETFLVAGAEAIACGRPVVLPATGGFTDYVTQENGVIAEHHDPKSLATAIEQAQATFINAPVEKISATISAKFDEQSVARQFEKFYLHLKP